MIATSDDPPQNQTLYLSNLNERVRTDDLKRAIYDTFSQFGPIMDIVAQRNMRMKGQAFVVFQDLSNACLAHKAMQGFMFFSKPMRVQFAKTKSDVVSKLDGTYLPRERETRTEGNMPITQAPKVSKSKIVPKPIPAKPQKVMDQPNNILFLQNLPENTNVSTLVVLFGQLPGFKEVRMVPNRCDIAFVEYESESYSSAAKESLQGFKLTPTHPLKITFAKK